MTETDGPGVTELTAEESWELLGSVDYGRVALVIGGAPEIFPVNIAARNPSLYFRTAEGTKLFGAVLGHGVAFETDLVDGDGGGAWSVVAKGTSREVTTRDEADAVEALGLKNWVPTVRRRLVALDIESVSGRRFRFGPQPDAPSEPSD